MCALFMQPLKKGADVWLISQRPEAGHDSAPQSGLTALAKPVTNVCAKQIAMPLTLIKGNRLAKLAKAHPERVCVILQHIGALIAKCVLRNYL